MSDTMKTDVSSNPFKSVVLDFNDTLSAIRFVEAFSKYQSDLPMPAAEVIELYIKNGLLTEVLTGRVSESEFWKRISIMTGTHPDVLSRVAVEICENRNVDPEMAAILEELKGCYKLALLTDNLQETFRYWLTRFGMINQFDVIINSSDIGITKSNPEIYRILVDRLKCRPAEVIFVDDRMSNIELACEMGMHGILFQSANLLRVQLVELGLLTPM